MQPSSRGAALLLAVCVVWRTGQGVQHHGQDVLVDQLDGPGPVGDLVVEVVGQPGPLELQLLGLEGRLR